MGAEGICAYLVWSPTEIRLHVGDVERRVGLHEAVGRPALQTIAVGDGGLLAAFGSEQVSVAGARVYSEGRTVISPPARNLWQDTVLAMTTLLDGRSDRGFMFEVVQTNSVLSMLVTGFETYCQTRFLEIEREGVAANFDALAACFSHVVRHLGGADAIRAEAAEEELTPSALLAKQINFQNYEKAKRTFREGFAVRFDQLGTSGEDLGRLKRTISFRHRIIHVSPLLGMLNGESVPPEDPVFSNRELAETSIELFDTFITKLHEATLRLRP